MAGGNGSRLGELTRWHAKPALPFGGQYRNIDFTLSNCINSGLRRIAVLTQYKAHSLIQHLHQGWSFLPAETGEFLQVWPAQQRCGDGWYAGTADAVYQNLDLIEEQRPGYVLVLAGDHVYKMDYGPMIEAHAASGADVTVGCVTVPLRQASAFGVVSVNPEGWVVRFDEKPESPAPLPRQPDMVLASMGIYAFDRKLLVQRLKSDAADAASQHDFGRNIVPGLIAPGLIHKAHVLAYPLRDPRSGKPAYWRDVGTLDSYWQANLEMLGEMPELDLHDRSWPIWTHQAQCPPPRFVGDGVALRSIVSGGCSIGGRIVQSLLSANCHVGADSIMAESIMLPNARIGRGCRIHRAVIDSGCEIPDGTVIGGNALRDSAHYEVSANQVTLVTAEGLARAAVRRAAAVKKADRARPVRRPAPAQTRAI
ncbi:MAG: glucose-1-phosphate adenylyltransferase, partial [Nitrococcus sp.]|nr:glucose-1-phosphate adenylyltransferase [Nitrococcus sp.]